MEPSYPPEIQREVDKNPLVKETRALQSLCLSLLQMGSRLDDETADCTPTAETTRSAADS